MQKPSQALVTKRGSGYTMNGKKIRSLVMETTALIEYAFSPGKRESASQMTVI